MDVILYDGLCGLCNGWVQFVLKRDHERVFRFAALQSQVAREILARHGINSDSTGTIYVVRESGQPTENVLSRSNAALYIFSRLPGMWRLVAMARILPKAIRDAIYGLIARYRYKIFGKYDVCLIPEPAYRDWFLDVPAAGKADF